MRLPPVIACLAIALAAPGCGGDEASAVNAKPIPKVTVVIEDDGYHPKRVRIEVGTRVTWVNASTDPHTAETPDAGFYEVDRRDLAERGQFDIHTLQPGEAESLVFDQLGEYDYGSSYDPNVVGVIQVVASDG